MKVLLVFAHPESRSLNGALRDVVVQELLVQGHEVRVSDLYAERWKSEVDRADFPALAGVNKFFRMRHLFLSGRAPSAVVHLQ